jgi:hypothetical protein
MHFKVNADGNIEVIKYIKLKNPAGKPITGLPNPVGMGSTGELPMMLLEIFWERIIMD